MTWDLSAMSKGGYLDVENDPLLKAKLDEIIADVIKKAGAFDGQLELGAVHGTGAKEIWRSITGLHEDGIFFGGEELKECWKKIQSSDPNQFEPKWLSAYWSLRELIRFCVEMDFSIEVNM